MMHSFKNGITITIPDDLPDKLDQWTQVKMWMSLILDPPPPLCAEPVIRKEYTHTKDGIKKRQAMLKRLDKQRRKK